jgi:hypothetical protein
MSEIKFTIYTNETVTETDNERRTKPSGGKSTAKRARPGDAGSSKPKRRTNKPRAKK